MWFFSFIQNCVFIHGGRFFSVIWLEGLYISTFNFPPIVDVHAYWILFYFFIFNIFFIHKYCLFISLGDMNVRCNLVSTAMTNVAIRNFYQHTFVPGCWLYQSYLGSVLFFSFNLFEL